MEKYIINKSKITSEFEMPDQQKKTYNISSNEVKVENISALFVKDKSSMWEYGSKGDEIQQNIILSNESSYEIQNIKLQETITAGGKFKTGSVTIDDVPYPDLDIASGMTLPSSIGANSSALVSYDLVIDNDITASIIAMSTKVTYSTNGLDNISEYTPTVSIDITDNKLQIEKSTEQKVAVTNSVIEYKHKITNTGKYKNTNIKFLDMLPSETTFVTGSVKIDNQEYPALDPTTGFSIRDLDINESVEISFSTKVEDVVIT